MTQAPQSIYTRFVGYRTDNCLHDRLDGFSAVLGRRKSDVVRYLLRGSQPFGDVHRGRWRLGADRRRNAGEQCRCSDGKGATKTVHGGVQALVGAIAVGRR